jgi:hypothetical protein
VPSTAEMKENGLNLSQFQMRLLEKIEELTLYTVQQAGPSANRLALSKRRMQKRLRLPHAWPPSRNSSVESCAEL